MKYLIFGLCAAGLAVVLTLAVARRKFKKKIIEREHFYKTIEELQKEKEQENKKIKEATQSLKELSKRFNEIELAYNQKNEKLNLLNKHLFDLRAIEEQTINSQKKQITEQITSFSNYLREKERNRLLKEANQLNEQCQKEIDNWIGINDSLLDFSKQQVEDAKILAQAEISDLQKSVNDLREKQRVINEEIQRKKKIEADKEFYQINLSEEDKSDIRTLKGIQESLRHPTVLDKLLYESFVKKPATDMIKRITEGQDFSGIYKITYLPTGEAYIGKATHISERWLQHIKSAFNLGTIANSALHIKMRKEGVWNFRFEIIEKVPKDKLTEREKYWISYYDTTKYGLNERIG